MKSFFEFCAQHYSGMWPELVLIGSQILGQAKSDKELCDRNKIRRPKPAKYSEVQDAQLTPDSYETPSVSAMILAGQRSGKSYLLKALVAYIAEYSLTVHFAPIYKEDGDDVEVSYDYLHFDTPTGSIADCLYNICDTLKAAGVPYRVEQSTQECSSIRLHNDFTIVICDGLPTESVAEYLKLGTCHTYIGEEIAWRLKRKNLSMTTVNKLYFMKGVSSPYSTPRFIAVSSVNDNDTLLKDEVEFFVRLATWEVNTELTAEILGHEFGQDPTRAMRDFGSRV